MVVKRQCSFCAGEVEPGTGTMFVKRDGSVFFFCSSSCRKQQLHLGRVGHRLKWTRAHAVKRAQEQSALQRTGRRPATAPRAPSRAPASRTETSAPATPAVPAASPSTPEPATADAAAAPATSSPEEASPPAKKSGGASKPAAARKPSAKKPKSPPSASASKD